MEEELVSTCNEESKHRKALKRYKMLEDNDEPIIKIEESDSLYTVEGKFMKAFNWYNNKYDKDKAKSFILAYAKTTNQKDIIEGVGACNDFKKVVGWVARIKTKGTVLPSKYEKFLDTSIKAMIEAGKKDAQSYKNKLDRLSEGREKAQEKFQQQVREMTSACIAELEFQFDEFIAHGFKQNFDVPKFLKNSKLCKDQCKEISNWFTERHLNEFSELCSGKDKFIKEAYSNFTKDQQTQLLTFVNNIVNSCEELLNNAPDKVKQQRKPRKKKVKTPDQLVKKLHYLAESKEFNLKSVPPTKIIGAEQIWVFNTKYRKLGVYNAADSAGFSLRGSTLLNFDNNTSVEKTLRKPGDILKGVLEGGKVAIRKTLQGIKCKEKRLTGRINDDVIILRVF